MASPSPHVRSARTKESGPWSLSLPLGSQEANKRKGVRDSQEECAQKLRTRARENGSKEGARVCAPSSLREEETTCVCRVELPSSFLFFSSPKNISFTPQMFLF